MKECLSLLTNDPLNRVVLISGRGKEDLEQWFDGVPLTLVVEHGGFYREPNQPWLSFFPQIPRWKRKIYPFLKALTVHYDGSFIEEKHFSIAWHYRALEHSIKEEEKEQILAALRSLPSNNEFLIYDEACTLEIRTQGINKGKFANIYMCQLPQPHFALAIGDGKTDEDLFKSVDKDFFTIKVGQPIDSSARFFLENQEDVLPFLISIAS